MLTANVLIGYLQWMESKSDTLSNLFLTRVIFRHAQPPEAAYKKRLVIKLLESKHTGIAPTWVEDPSLDR